VNEIAVINATPTASTAKQQLACPTNVNRHCDRTRHKPDHHPRTLRPDELKRLMRPPPPAAVPALAIAAFAGLRPTGLQTLHWADVRLKDGYILPSSVCGCLDA
jgi:integrase